MLPQMQQDEGGKTPAQITVPCLIESQRRHGRGAQSQHDAVLRHASGALGVFHVRHDHLGNAVQRRLTNFLAGSSASFAQVVKEQPSD